MAFFSNTLYISPHSLLTCMAFEEKPSVILILVLLYIMCVPPSLHGFLRYFLFVFDFLQFEYNIPSCRFYSIYPAWYSLAFWICGMVSAINFGIVSANYYFTYFFCSFFFLPLLVFLLCIRYSFCNCFTVLGYSVPFLSIFFPLRFSVWDTFICISSHSVIFFLRHVQS